MSAYSVYAKGSKGAWKHVGDDHRLDLVAEAVRELKRQGYAVRVSCLRLAK